MATAEFSTSADTMYTFTVCKTDRRQESAVLHRELSSALCVELWWWGEGWREAQEARDICIFKLIISLYSRNQHTILKQIICQLKTKKAQLSQFLSFEAFFYFFERALVFLSSVLFTHASFDDCIFSL